MYYQYILIFSSFHTKRQNCGIFNSCKTRNLQGKPKIPCYMYWLHFFKMCLTVWILPFQRQRNFGSVSQSSDNSTGAGTCFVGFNENHNFWLNLLHCNLHVCHLFQAKKELTLAKGVTDFSWTKRLLNADFIPSDVGKAGPELIAAQVSPRISEKLITGKLMSESTKSYFRDKIELNLGLKILISICDKYLVQFVYG